ncbi:MAG: L-serine ammonia-lyase [Psychromonas sp.]|nr:L-serine ammonia-lyase [Psychromonas sp.]
MLSIFDIYKIGVGPSSSHTNGPMIAGFDFVQKISPELQRVKRIEVALYGSLSLTGKGHHTDRAVMLGLQGNKPEFIDIPAANELMKKNLDAGKLALLGTHLIDFSCQSHIQFHREALPRHENGMSISAYTVDNELLQKETYYSVGGGFIVTEEELKNGQQGKCVELEFPFRSAEELLQQAEKKGFSIGGMILRNELAYRSDQEITEKAEQIWQVMSSCIERGMATEGILEGGLHVTRRAPALLKKLEASKGLMDDPMQVMDWINVFAFAVSEENAAGGQVITSPTNGAAGVIPAVLMYYHKFIQPLDSKKVRDFLAVSGVMGMLYKVNASISGAEVGCQGEIGVSSSMAAAGLTSLLGGSNEQICIAAEIAMEHSLGMTCDPVAGLVQIPCIERNAMGAMKAINASRMALTRTSKSLISLDKVIETMYQTGKDMNNKYRETSLGGLAIIHLAPCE